MEINEITETIIGAAIAVHRDLGPGLLESAYKTCTLHELVQRGLRVETEKAMAVRSSTSRSNSALPACSAVGDYVVPFPKSRTKG